MFLKRLELSGFKSFAKAVSVEFENGVTAVVGPNGSGKSNISDSVRWVLGEQSARNLRGAKMEDIIFSGSEGRAAQNMAEVTLVLNNEKKQLSVDYTEVAVTRRVFRSGDSEYLMNGQPCRLKDIIELFMDSGIGRESFSIIGQGRVEEILSSKSEDRRAIFEEAAGVRKYKQRKQQAAKKLHDTEDNLSRVRDILYEIESRLEPLKEQASVAEEFLGLKDDLRQVETGVLVEEIKERHEKWSMAGEKLQELESQHQRAASALKGQQKEKDRRRKLLENAETKLDDVQNQLLLASEEAEKQEGLRELWNERKKHYSENRTQYRKELEQLQAEREALESERSRAQSVLEEAVKKAEEADEELQRLLTRLSAATGDKESVLEDWKSEYFELLNHKTSAANDLKFIQDQLERSERVAASKTEAYEKRQAELDELIDAFQTAENNWNQQVQQKKDLQKSWKETNLQYDELRKSYEKKETFYYEALHRLHQLDAKLESMKTMQQEYSGFFHGVKELLKDKDHRFPGIAGAVAELIHVPESHTTALETALGAAQQHVVTNDESAAQKAIGYLRKHKLGRATFLPLTTIKPRTIGAADRKKLNQVEGCLGTAAEAVTSDKAHERVVEHLLGNVILTETLDQAKLAAAAVQHRYRVVTLEGDIVNAGGSMTGGSRQTKQASLLGRRQEIDKLQAQKDKLQQQTDKAETQLAETKRAGSRLNDQLAETRKKAEAVTEAEAAARSAYEELTLKKQHEEERTEQLRFELEEMKREFAAATAKKQEKQSLLNEAERKLAQADKQISELTEAREEDRTREEELRERISELKAVKAAVQEQVRSARENNERIQAAVQKLTREIIEKDEANSLLEAELSESALDSSSIEENLKESRAERKRLQRELANLKETRKQLADEVEELDEACSRARNQLTYCSEQKHSVELEKGRLDVELDTRLEKLQQEYELTFEAAEAELPLQEPIEDAVRKVKLLKMSMEELGPVNIGAIDEYGEVKERFEFLSGQQMDLEEAKASLEAIIKEMDTEMTTRFMDAFTEIQTHFKDVFRSLFGGGRASLELTNGDDLLHTGVDITAQPPGKKLQHLALLSGGERALTAIALLFAILRARPVPFCVLDEVEAALDEANVHRFASYLKEFSRDTQFIVVTHRKGTMEEADALYGITMQESGVSDIVSVRLEESRELVEAGALKEENK
ncbi:chromosome segregation protein SMC [Bacillus daqingensis]|uniref:Chromosome partition protein Smc n=1 Tax=Bacillus daqingensis TaxID=872396 RepID=A0ABV9NUD0_9BACI